MDRDVVRIESLEPAFKEMVQSASLNNMATIHRGKEGKGWESNGDPTEIALQVLAHKAGLGKPHLFVPPSCYGTNPNLVVALPSVVDHF